MSAIYPGFPEPSEFIPYAAQYVRLVPEADVVKALRDSVDEVAAFAAPWNIERAQTWRYQPGKWTLCEVLGHLCDTERIFSYRALRIARGDKTPLPSFDQDLFVANAPYDTFTPAELIEELRALRKTTVSLYAHLTQDAWSRMGTSSNHPFSVRAFAYLTVGHERHHLNILRERYTLE